MRFLVTALLLSCCAVTGYSQESTEDPVATTEEGGSDVANVDSKNSGCPCGKPSGKPK